MSVPVILDPEARDEFDEGYDYYEGQRGGLGESFADAVQIALDRIGGMPQLHRAVFREYPAGDGPRVPVLRVLPRGGVPGPGAVRVPHEAGP